MAEKDIEATKPTPIPFFRQVFDKAGITPEIQKWDYAGSGTEEDPYVVTWIDHDPRNPMLYRNGRLQSLLHSQHWPWLSSPRHSAVEQMRL